MTGLPGKRPSGPMIRGMALTPTKRPQRGIMTVLSAALVLTALSPVAAKPAQDPYTAAARLGMAVLQQWYSNPTGLWRTTGWWNSANALGDVVRYSALTGDATYRDDIANTFERHKAGGFLNHYFDDEGWWALTWIDAYDLTGDARYLAMAKSIFENLTTGWDDTCGGGIWWNKDRKYKNAIANELFLAVAARLALRAPGSRGPGSYRDWALREWVWFDASGMINPHHLINDGLDRSCKNNGGTTWTYNQGVILGGLADLSRLTGNGKYMRRARQIADAALGTLVTPGHILAEPCEAHGDCGGDGPQFKGIFIRNLAALNTSVRSDKYRRFIRANADSIWSHDRNSVSQLGLRWYGPFDKADASRQSSAMDAILAAVQSERR